MFGYMHFVEEMEDSFHCFAWKKYDEEFRQLRATSILPWLHFDECIYMKATSEPFRGMQQQKQQPQHPGPCPGPAVVHHKQEVPEGYCRRFSIGICTKPPMECHYKHKYFKCQEAHAFLMCQQPRKHAHAPKHTPKPNKSPSGNTT